MIGPLDNDLIKNYARMARSDRGADHRPWPGAGRKRAPVPNTLVEIWQANAGGRYRHKKDTYLRPDRPEFRRLRADPDGRERLLLLPHRQARRLSMAQPWSTTGGPPISMSRSSATAFGQRLITQLYFEGDPLIPICPIVQTIPTPDAVDQLTARLDMNATIPLDSIAYKFDIVLRGRRSTLFENRLEGN
jgi:protocatechuate 3,4-dioxygenase beta subunit